MYSSKSGDHGYARTPADEQVAAGDDHIASEETHDTALEYLGSFAVNVRKLMTHTKKKVDFFIEDSFVELDASFQALKQVSQPSSWMPQYQLMNRLCVRLRMEPQRVS